MPITRILVTQPGFLDGTDKIKPNGKTWDTTAFIPEGNEPISHACMDIFQLPQG